MPSPWALLGCVVFSLVLFFGWNNFFIVDIFAVLTLVRTAFRLVVGHLTFILEIWVATAPASVFQVGKETTRAGLTIGVAQFVGLGFTFAGDQYIFLAALCEFESLAYWMVVFHCDGVLWGGGEPPRCLDYWLSNSMMRSLSACQRLRSWLIL